MSTVGNNIQNAIKAYNAANRGDLNSTSGDNSPSGANDDFASLVKSAISEAVKINQRSEKLSIDAMNDHADLSKVVTAVAEAQVTLQTVVAVRDKVLQAYKDIIRMPM